MFHAVTSSGPNTEPSPGATGTCPLCGGPVLARCGKVNVWHWAHRAGQDCDAWAEPLTDWHRAYQQVVPPERCEVIIGRHRADVVAATGHVLELQHSGISVDDIGNREAHYGPRMVWLFDAREAYETERLTIRRGKNDDYVSFRWKHPRRSVVSCRRPVLLDLGEGLLLAVKKIYPGPPCRGWGYIFETVDLWRWLRDGTGLTALRWTGGQHRDLVDRIVRAATYLSGGQAPILASSQADRAIKAALFAGGNPSNAVRAALSAARDHVHLAGLHDHAQLKPRWSAAGRITVVCRCGDVHSYKLGPEDYDRWSRWRDAQDWPLAFQVLCPAAPGRSHTLHVPAPPPHPWGAWG